MKTGKHRKTKYLFTLVNLQASLEPPQSKHFQSRSLFSTILAIRESFAPLSKKDEEQLLGHCLLSCISAIKSSLKSHQCIHE